MASISVAEVLEAIRNIHTDDAGFTSEELATELRVSRDKANSIIRDLHKAQKLECAGRRKIIRVDGLNGVIPVYRLVTSLPATSL